MHGVVLVLKTLWHLYIAIGKDQKAIWKYRAFYFRSMTSMTTNSISDNATAVAIAKENWLQSYPKPEPENETEKWWYETIDSAGPVESDEQGIWAFMLRV